MSIKSAESLVKLARLIEEGKIIHIQQHSDGVKITVFSDPKSGNHGHFGGKDLVSAIENIPE